MIMKFWDCFRSTVGVIFLTSIMVFSIADETPEATSATAAMNLILVEAYGKNVQSAGIENVNPLLKDTFVGAYSTLGTTEAIAAFQHLGPHLTYVLDLAKSPNASKTELLVALRAKTLAFSYAVNFLICFLYYHFVEYIYPQPCGTLTSYMLMFSQQGISELMEKIRIVFNGEIFDSTERDLEEFLKKMENIKYVADDCIGDSTLFRRGPTGWTITQIGHYETVRKRIARKILGIEHTINDMFGNIIFEFKEPPIIHLYEGSVSCIWKRAVEAPHLWKVAAEMYYDFEEGKYDIVQLILNIAREEAVVRGINQETIIQQWEKCRPSEPVSIEGEQKQWKHNLKF